MQQLQRGYNIKIKSYTTKRLYSMVYMSQNDNYGWQM